MAHWLTAALSLHFCLRMLLSGSQQGFNHSILLSCFIPIAVLLCKAEHIKLLKIGKKRDISKLLLIQLPLRRHTLTEVAFVFPINLQHICILHVGINLLQWFHLIML